VIGSVVSSISSGLSFANNTHTFVTNAVRESALSAIPSWLDKEKTSTAMSKRKKRTPTQTCQDNFDANGKKKQRDERHKATFKSVTNLLQANMHNERSGIHCCTDQ
jgi:hypothetical protein